MQRLQIKQTQGYKRSRKMSGGAAANYLLAGSYNHPRVRLPFCEPRSLCGLTQLRSLDGITSAESCFHSSHGSRVREPTVQHSVTRWLVLTAAGRCCEGRMLQVTTFASHHPARSLPPPPLIHQSLVDRTATAFHQYNNPRSHCQSLSWRSMLLVSSAARR